MIRFLLLFKIEWTNERPGLMFACAVITACAGLAIDTSVLP